MDLRDKIERKGFRRPFFWINGVSRRMEIEWRACNESEYREIVKSGKKAKRENMATSHINRVSVLT